MNSLFLIIYLIVAVISGCALGVPIKEYIAGISWIDDSLELSSCGLSDGGCRIISVIIAVIIALCIFSAIKESLEINNVVPAIVCVLLIPLFIFVASFILTLIGLAIYWLFVGSFLIMIIIIAILVVSFS